MRDRQIQLVRDSGVLGVGHGGFGGLGDQIGAEAVSKAPQPSAPLCADGSRRGVLPSFDESEVSIGWLSPPHPRFDFNHVVLTVLAEFEVPASICVD